MILSAYTIYNSGDKPYTPESISAEYAKIAVPLWIAIGAVIAGILLNVALPLPKNKKKALKDPFVQLRILQKKLPADCNLTGIKRQRELRKVYRTGCAILCTIAFMPAITVLCNYDLFTVSNLTPALLRTVFALLIGVIVSAVILFILSVIERRSAEREIEWTKIALSEAPKADIKVVNNNENKIKIARLILVGAACALIVIGLTQDGFHEVLQKAIRICTECIGLG